MTFYFKPPRGDIQFHRLQECLEERISYLKYVQISEDISECNEGFKFEYLTDGSALDRTGHFMLRLFASKLVGLESFLLHSESVLFEKRLKCLSHFEIKKELRTAQRHVKEILSSGFLLPRYKIFLQNFTSLCERIISSGGLCHVFTDAHPLNCNKFNLSVPFTYCLPMVRTRRVDLRGGLAVVPCSEWSTLLSCVFANHIKYGLQQLSHSRSYQIIWDDDRIKLLYQIVKQQSGFYSSEEACSTMTLLAKDVDGRSIFFPPCMKNMHKILRQRHRLSHLSRFYYSLFLKDVGMPVTESLNFWSQEYSQTNTNCASCSHSWQRDNRKYVYSIRHIYGLEGSRRVYQSPRCKQVQDMSLSPSADGGCPFADFDEEKLLNCLHQEIKSEKQSIVLLKEAKNEKGPAEACRLYCQMLHNLANKSSISAPENIVTVQEDIDLTALHPSKFYKYICEATS
ncbi:DNA primase large subunit-like isoform X1 [Frankliniella occidentalis]|uniref:DNA primase large subunit-like isoform X1 n=1 Tax=Frankliniella occidentalis TaxID=133901 RepID=A0A6J1T4L6_FRAOC|nr:DNA primase large subunit-like isoform X1 [Frankliniella occidentalis]